MTNATARQEKLFTLFGGIAILLWSASIASMRELVEDVGVITAATSALLLGGIVGLLYLGLVERKWRLLFRLPPRYLIVGSLLITIYLDCLYLALGLTTSRRPVLDIGLINYLWPGLTLLLSVPLLHRRARPALLVGVLLSFVGVVVSTFQQGIPTWAQFTHNATEHWLAYLLALTAAVSWALYSNLSRKWAGTALVSGMPLFIFIAGAVMALVRLFTPAPPPHWTPHAFGSLLFQALGPTLLGYILWDYGVQRGRFTLLASLSNFTPLFSTLISSAYLQIPLGAAIWLAMALIIGGAILCNMSVTARDEL